MVTKAVKTAEIVMGLEVVSLYGSTLKSMLELKRKYSLLYQKLGVYSSMVFNRLSVTNL
jgi:hypothetical protein